jgi:hypothetical protein
MFINLGVLRILAAFRKGWGGEGGETPNMEQKRRGKERCKKRESRMVVTAFRDLWQSINSSPLPRPLIGVKILAIEFRWKSEPGLALSHFTQSSSLP